MLASDPLLASIDRMWNANPLHDVIPVDWAEVVRALRTVWLRSMADPGRAMTAAVELNAKMWTCRHRGLEQRRRPLAGPAGRPRRGPGLGAGDKRFEAPGMAQQPGLPDAQGHVPAGLRLPAEAGRGGGPRPAERERLRFHLQQFVNATSPTLLLLSNPRPCAG